MVDEQLIQQTIACWQPYYERPLTREDALIIIERLGGLLDLLERWAQEDGEALYRSFMFWSGHGQDEPWFEAMNSLWNRLVSPYNVYHASENSPHYQGILDDQASRRVHRRHDRDPADVG